MTSVGLSVNDKAANTVVTLQTPSTTGINVTLNKHKEVSFMIEDIAKMVTRPDLLMGYMEYGVAVIGEQNLVRDPTPSMGAEDFAFMLQAKPGSYVWIGNGPTEGSCLLHNPHYDFNDQVLPIGASYWATLVEQTLARHA